MSRVFDVRAIPTISAVTGGDDWMVIVAPRASRVGQYFFAIASLTIAPAGAVGVSLAVNARPRRIAMPSASK